MVVGRIHEEKADWMQSSRYSRWTSQLLNYSTNGVSYGLSIHSLHRTRATILIGASSMFHRTRLSWSSLAAIIILECKIYGQQSWQCHLVTKLTLSNELHHRNSIITPRLSANPRRLCNFEWLVNERNQHIICDRKLILRNGCHYI